jgi:hypothetical protein
MPIWDIGRITQPNLLWGAEVRGRFHECPKCGIALLTGERSGFCCGPNGKYLAAVPDLPPLPEEYNAFVNQPSISAHSRTLNLIFSFASMETTEEFPWLKYSKHIPSFFSVQGKIYHRLRPKHRDSSVRWLLFDGFSDSSIPHSKWASKLPSHWISGVKDALTRVNPFVQSLLQLGQLPEELCPEANIELREGSGLNEIAAIMNFNNTTNTQVQPRKLVMVDRSGMESYLGVTSRLWEPLAYPLFFPHGSLGWGISSSLEASSTGPPINGVDDDEVTATQIWYYRLRLLRDERFSIFGRLANEYLVDMFSRNLEARLHYIRMNQVNSH